MSHIDVEYAIKKDVRNNPIVREVDTRQRAEFLQTAGVWALIVFMALFAAWQHFERWSHNFTIEQLTHERAEEEAINRRLRLLIETLTAPERIERIATQDLHMVVPPTASTVVVERRRTTTVDKAVVASASPLPGGGR